MVGSPCFSHLVLELTTGIIDCSSLVLCYIGHYLERSVFKSVCEPHTFIALLETNCHGQILITRSITSVIMA